MVDEVAIFLDSFGGFGVVAGAVKVGTFLQSYGYEIRYVLADPDIGKQIGKLFPELTPSFTSEHSFIGLLKEREIITINHVGRLLYGFNPGSFIHITDMDEVDDDPRISHISIRPGLAAYSGAVRIVGPYGTIDEVQGMAPRIYQPCNIGQLPNPGEEDIRQVLADPAARNISENTTRIMSQCDRIGICYMAEPSAAVNLIRGAYAASQNSEETLGIAILTSRTDSGYIRGLCRKLDARPTMIGIRGEVEFAKGSRLVVSFLPYQPQMIATRLLFSAEIPSAVTGGNSLSDAVYNLAYRKGVGIFYETRTWKRLTSEAIQEAMHKEKEHGGSDFGAISRFLKRGEGTDPIAKVLGNRDAEAEYTETQREAMRKLLRIPNVENPFVQHAVLATLQADLFRGLRRTDPHKASVKLMA